MKRIANLYSQATSLEALHQGYLEARAGKRARLACHVFERRLGAQLDDLAQSLEAGTYRPRPYNTFTIQEPKPREISAPAFRDRVVQHAVAHVIQPIFDRTFIDQSFACRPGLGTHAAADYAQQAMALSRPDAYTLHMDVRKFYYSIDRTILRSLVERKIKDRRLVDLMMQFAHMDKPKGLPIGNLLSQIHALIYLNQVDHYIKRDLRVKRYCRYVDDLLLLDLTRDEAFAHKAAIEGFLADRLLLGLSKATIAPTLRGINYVGYRTWPTRRFVRKHALQVFRSAAKRSDLQATISSLGHAKKTASHAHMVHHLKEHHHALYLQLPKSHRCDHHLPDAAA
jgi:RNA-directed DNA polymerase